MPSKLCSRHPLSVRFCRDVGHGQAVALGDSTLPLLSETLSTTTKKCQAVPLLFVFGTLYFIFQYLR
jgi:hypothetical protein